MIATKINWKDQLLDKTVVWKQRSKSFADDYRLGKQTVSVGVGP
jgi:hypothetical protein